MQRPARLRPGGAPPFQASAMGKLTSMAPRVGGLEPRLRLAPKVAEPFYSTREWRALAASCKRAAGYRCQRPGCGSSDRLIADHIVERKDGGADLDRRNIEVLCGTCHARKTAEARQRRARGQR